MECSGLPTAYRLSSGTTGISCGPDGAFVCDIPLLERVGPNGWRPRSVPTLNDALSKCYGLPIDSKALVRGLIAVADAVERGELGLAQVSVLQLRLPEPPGPDRAGQSAGEVADLVLKLHQCRLLKAEWIPAQHPRWPAGSPDSVGGEFAPASGSVAADSPARLIPVQAASVPFETMPGELVKPGELVRPIPSEIVPPLAVKPAGRPGTLPVNPRPDRPECVEEWESAFEFCAKLQARGQLGVGDYRGMGRTLRECMMGQVSEECGGNII